MDNMTPPGSLWLVDELYARRDAAHRKHGANSIEAMSAFDPRWLSVLVEEVGETAHALTYDSGAGAPQLLDELYDVAAVVTAWISRLEQAGTRLPSGRRAGDGRRTAPAGVQGR